MHEHQNLVNPNKSCSKPLYISGDVFTAAGNTTTPNEFTTPTGRGKIIGMELVLGNNTIADLAAGTISVSVSGITVIENASLLKFGALFENSRQPIMFFTPLDEGITIQYSVLLGTANAVIVATNFLFYNPFQQ